MAQQSVEQTFQIAFKHHQAGQFAEAESIYRQILAQIPNHVESLHLLGVLAHQTGRNDLAIDLIRRAIALRPRHATAYFNLGNALAQNGDMEKAIVAYKQAIAIDPRTPEVFCNLGNTCRSLGMFDEAIAAYSDAIALKPTHAPYFSNLGLALKNAGRLDEAIAEYRRAISLKPQYAEAFSNLGNALKDQGRFEEAISAFGESIAIKPGTAETHSNLGNALRELKKFDEAIAAYQRAIALKPTYAEAHNNLGTVFREKGRTFIHPSSPSAHYDPRAALEGEERLDQAIAAYRQAIALNPSLPDPHYNLGLALGEKGLVDQAIAAYRQAVALKPTFAQAHVDLSIALLLAGNYADGWAEYEWRWKRGDYRPRNFSQPQWHGQPLEGKTILVHAEQGFGDTIQFIRFLPVVAHRGGRIVVECQAQLLRLFQDVSETCTLVVRDETLPAFDVCCPLLSLPHALGLTNLEHIPREFPYLRAGSDIAAKWRDRLAADSQTLEVGLVWAGNKLNLNDHNRSIPLSALSPFSRVPRVRFHSLQKEAPADLLQNPPADFELVDHKNELDDFAETAGLVANLDLVISVDTAVAHLAGALGKPVWLLLPFAPDWRWLLAREDSPWYPTMRLFRQPARGDWQSVIQRVAAELITIV